MFSHASWTGVQLQPCNTTCTALTSLRNSRKCVTAHLVQSVHTVGSDRRLLQSHNLPWHFHLHLWGTKPNILRTFNAWKMSTWPWDLHSTQTVTQWDTYQSHSKDRKLKWKRFLWLNIYMAGTWLGTHGHQSLVQISFITKSPAPVYLPLHFESNLGAITDRILRLCFRFS